MLERQCASIAATDDVEACKVVAKRMSRAIADSLAGTERISSVVSSVYTFSRPESQELELVDVREILNVAIQLARAEMRPRAQLLRDDEDLPRVRGSTTRLVQVFLNLLMNAAQAIPEGRPHENQIRVSMRFRAGEVIVEVSDTGRGIAPEQLGRIYDPFFSTLPVGRGMGLGLSISHAALQAMGGSIEVESEVAKGSTFRVRLPAVHESTPSRVLSQRSLSHAVPGRRKVLIIDDEPPYG